MFVLVYLTPPDLFGSIDWVRIHVFYKQYTAEAIHEGRLPLWSRSRRDRAPAARLVAGERDRDDPRPFRPRRSSSRSTRRFLLAGALTSLSSLLAISLALRVLARRRAAAA